MKKAICGLALLLTPLITAGQEANETDQPSLATQAAISLDPVPTEALTPDLSVLTEADLQRLTEDANLNSAESSRIQGPAVVMRATNYVIVQSVTRSLSETGAEMLQTNRNIFYGDGSKIAPTLPGNREVQTDKENVIEQGPNYKILREVRQFLAEDGTRSSKTNDLAVFTTEEAFSEAVARPPELLDRGPHHKLVRKLVPDRRSDGIPRARRVSYTEIGSGLSYRDESGSWQDSEARFEITENGVIARKTQHKVALASSPAAQNPVEVQMPDGQILRSRVLGLGYFDRKTGASVVIAELQDAQAELNPAKDELTYHNSFSGVKADLRYVIKAAGLEQDVILTERPPGPEAFGFNVESSELEVITEFLLNVRPEVRERVVEHGAKRANATEFAEPDVLDCTVDFGSMHISRGTAFGSWSPTVAGTNKASVTVMKEWQVIDGRTILFEKISAEEAQPLLQTLPPARAEAGMKPRASFQRQLPKTHLAASIGAAKPVRLLAQTKHARGVVLDYVLLANQSNLTLAPGTYHVQNFVAVSGITTIQSGAVVKFAPGKTLQISGAISCQTSSGKAYFVAENDNSVGDQVVAGTPNGYYANAAISLYNVNSGTLLTNLEIRNATMAIDDYSPSTSHTIRSCQITDCSIGVRGYYSTVYLEYVRVCNVPTVTYNSGSSLFSETGTTGYCPPGGISLVSGVSPLGTRRNDWSGFVGFQFVVGASPITVTHLGRWVLGGNTGSHLLRLFDSTGTPLATGYASVNTAGALSGDFLYAPIQAPVTLSAGATYVLMSQEIVGGDLWCDYGSTSLSLNPGANSPHAAYASNTYPPYYGAGGGSGLSYGPVSLRYSLAANTPPTISMIADLTVTRDSTTGPIGFTVGDNETSPNSLSVTAISGNQTLVPGANITLGGSGANRTITIIPASGQIGSATITVTVSDGSLSTTRSFVLTVTHPTGSSGSLIASLTANGYARNDHEGWVGFQFTVGSSPIQVTELGRWVLSGNASSHSVQLFNSDGTTLGTPVTVNTAGKPPNQFTYAPLGTPITLAAGTTYAVMSLEVYYGDQWLDYGGTTLALANVANSPHGLYRYSTPPNYGAFNGLGKAYVPVNLKYGAPNTPPTISAIGNVTVIVNGSSGPINFTVNDTESSAASLSISAMSGNTVFLPNANIILGGSGGNRTVSVSPTPGQYGSATVTLTVSDGALTATRSFTVTVPSDYDNDALPDLWEIAYFGSISARTGTDDGDGDGLPNSWEHALGLNPTINEVETLRRNISYDTLNRVRAVSGGVSAVITPDNESNIEQVSHQ